jgi:hypothetical protein
MVREGGVGAAREHIVVVIQVQRHRHAQFPHPRQAGRSPGLVATRPHQRQQQAGQDQHDGDDHQQLDQRER